MPRLHIDGETYSSIDIKSSGLYKYVSSLDFEILMLAYCFDDENVQIIDLAKGEKLPFRFTDALMDPNIKKYAHNASFERNILKAIGYDVPIDQWRCTMVKAAYCGLPLGLEALSKALELTDKAKLKTGRALIRYFCMPNTNKRSVRLRNFWHHDEKQWEQFKEYCVGDVIAEREIHRQLSAYKISDFERKNYILDQIINDNGVLVDMQLAIMAYRLDDHMSGEIRSKIKDITGIDNPNSPAQIKAWLTIQTGNEIKSLAKDKLNSLIAECEPGAVRDVLELRAKSSKTSTKKYISMLNCASSEDNRVRGLFQYYGANRTGRWAGRLVQLQNLPRNYIKDIDVPRNIIRTKNIEESKHCHDNIPSLLSQLIRTAFIAPPGTILGVADFSAIEARVIAWLADEKWRLDVFKSHGKIYEASASMMFNVPIESIEKGSELRTKGKIAELALGYQGSLGALKAMGGESMGLSDEEMKLIVKKWRTANPNIVKFWYSVEKAALIAISQKRKVVRNHGLEFYSDKLNFIVKLPSGRELFYREPKLGQNRWGKTAVQYKGVDGMTKQWTYIDTYGGKLTENIVQAVARDILAFSMMSLHNEGYKITMHIHDEVVCEIPNEQEVLDDMCGIMSREIPWAKGLPLSADGFMSTFYKKD